MNSIKTIIKAGLIVSVIAFLADCGSPEVEPTILQYPIDSVIIADYIKEKGYDHEKLDTLDLFTTYFIGNSEVRSSGPMIYTILDEGDGEILDYDDIVSFDYAIRLTNDSVKLTNNAALAQEYGIYYEENTSFYKSIKFTLSRSSASTPSFMSRFMGDTFSAGLSVTVPKMKVGGHARLIVPSTIAYSNYDLDYIIKVDSVDKLISIPANSVIIADIYPVFVRKATTN